MEFLEESYRYQNIPVFTDTGKGISGLSSYRGYYSDLALIPTESHSGLSSNEFYNMLEKVLDTTLVGYKGGYYLMDSETPLWLSEEGFCSSIAIVGISKSDDGQSLILKTKDTDR